MNRQRNKSKMYIHIDHNADCWEKRIKFFVPGALDPLQL